VSLDDIMVTRLLRLGSMELKLILTLEEEEKRIFSTADAYRILKSSKDSVNSALYRLRMKGRIEEIERGKYLLIPSKAGYRGKWAEIPFIVASKIVEPSYIGFASALNYWGMTEQVPSTVFVVTTKRKRNLEYGSVKFKFVTFSNKRFFGIVEGEIDDEKFKISSKEKTIADGLIYPKYCGGLDEVVKGIWESQDELDFVKVWDYSNEMKNESAKRRLLYILNILGIKKAYRERPDVPPKGLMWLDPNGPKKALEYSKEYGLIINRTKDELLSWRGY
jgi:predicted transcriptional regulator of viral defense system